MVDIACLEILPEEVVSFLKRDISLKVLCRKILFERIVERTAQAKGITVTDAEIQQAADMFRYQNRIETATATHDWLLDQMISADDWESGIRAKLLSQKLAHHLFDQDVKTYFAQNKVDFECVVLYRLTVPYRALVQELFYAIDEEEISFFEAAHLYDVDEQRRLQCGFEGQLTRWQLEPDLAARIFGAQTNQVIGPIESENHHHLYLVQAFIEPTLTAAIYETIQTRFWNEWLESELTYLIHHDSTHPDSTVDLETNGP